MRNPGWSQDSLAGRLSLYFGLGTLLILGLLGTVLFVVISQMVQSRDARELVSKTEAVRQLLADINQPEQLSESLRRIRATEIGHDDLDIGVLIDNVWLLRPEQALVEHVEQHEAESEHQSDLQMSYLANRRSWEMRHLSHRMSSAPSPAVEVVVAIDVTETRNLVSNLRNVLILIGLAGAALIAVLTWWATSRALAPLARVGREAENMTAQALGTPLSVENAPVEIRGLINSLNQMLARLQTSFGSLRHFSADIAHELRTPVNALLTQTQVMLSKERTIDEYRETLHQGLEELTRLQRMVADMLFIARAEQAVSTTPLENIDVSRIASEVVEYVELVASEKEQTITVHGHLCAPGNALMLRRAITNLLTNAVRYAPCGAAIDLTLNSTANEAEIEVINPSLQTMTQAQVDRLFDRFARHPDADNAPNAGLGLGLSIVQSIMLVHGGQASASHAAGLFRVRLQWPLAEMTEM